MRLCATPILVASCLIAAAPSHAARRPLDVLADRSVDGAELRPRLLAFADSVASSDSVLASRAMAWAGSSFARDGEPDSAVACYERAAAIDPSEERRTELASALLLRLAAGDAARARDVLRPVQPADPDRPSNMYASLQGLFAWSHYLAGQPDSAARLFKPNEPLLSQTPEWRYRMACVAFELQDWARAITLLTPLAVASRAFDSDVMSMINQSASKMNVERRLGPMLVQEIYQRDQVEQELLSELGARRVAFRGTDGFPLGGTVLGRRGGSRRAAIVVVAPGDTLASYDSLAVGLRRMGLAVMLLDPRGSGHSVAPSCPLPDSWRGRELEMREAVAGDVAVAAGALAREVGSDSTQYVVVGIGETAPIAVQAGARRGVRAVMLVSPSASPADRGPLRAAVATLKPPIYLQISGEDLSCRDLTNTLYEATNPRASRVADSESFGTRATLFRYDPRIFARFKLWLSETWPSRAAPRATPPSRPRPG
jgi:hypothetical protein